MTGRVKSSLMRMIKAPLVHVVEILHRDLFRGGREHEIKGSALRDVRRRPYSSTVSFDN
jgi:hypothetical protein